MSERIDELWGTLEAWLAKHAPPVAKNLNPGATEEALAQADEQLGGLLNAEARAWFARHDGEASEGDALLGDQLYSLAEALAQRASLLSIKGDPLTDWQPTWLPIATDHAGNCHYVDLASGNVRDFDHEGWEHAHISESLAEYLEVVVRAFEETSPEWDEDEGWLVDGDCDWTPFEDRDFFPLEPEDLNPAARELAELLGQARACMSDGDPEGALKLFDQAVALQPQDLDARFARARARFKHGDHDGAREDLQSCLELNPEALRVLGQVNLAAGDTDAAKQAFEGYLDRVATRTDFFGKVEISGPPGVELVVRLLEQLGADLSGS